MEYLQEHNYTNFKRFVKTLEVADDPALMEAYIAAHGEGKVWKEVTQGIRAVGILDMEIYLSGTTLVMIMETVPDFNHDEAMAKLGTLPRQAEWEAHMSQYQVASPDASADEKWKIVQRIFKLDK